MFVFVACDELGIQSSANASWYAACLVTAVILSHSASVNQDSHACLVIWSGNKRQQVRGFILKGYTDHVVSTLHISYLLTPGWRRSQSFSSLHIPNRASVHADRASK